MLNNPQIKLIQAAVRTAGLRGKGSDFESRYRMLLRRYKRPNGRPVTSCKQLNNWQLEDLLAICEAHGWRMPGKPEDYFRSKILKFGDYASFAQQSAIQHLAGDMGWQDHQLEGFLKRMTEKDGWFIKSVDSLTPLMAYKVIEGLKAILGRETGKQYSNLKQIQEDMEVSTDGETRKVG